MKLNQLAECNQKQTNGFMGFSKVQDDIMRSFIFGAWTPKKEK